MYFQVHTRHIDCSGPSGTCNCAVAVREGNDILGIRACDGHVTLIRYMRDPNTPDGQADIKLMRSNSHYTLYRVGTFMFINDSVGFSLLTVFSRIEVPGLD